MTTAAPSTALVMIQPVFTDAERLALAGYLAGYRGATIFAWATPGSGPLSWCGASGGRGLCEPVTRTGMTLVVPDRPTRGRS